MRTRLVITALSFALLTLPIAARTTWDLVTREEQARDNAAAHRPGPADLPAPPLIQLLRPDISRPISNPTTIEVRFSAGSGAAIDMRSFRATYGWLGINITNRLLEHATKTSDTLLAQNVNLPLGNHRVTLSIADMSGKTASRTFRFSVAR
jgi:hypothetical protein